MKIPRVVEQVGFNAQSIPGNAAVAGFQRLAQATFSKGVEIENRKRTARDIAEENEALLNAQEQLDALDELQQDPDFFIKENGIDFLRERVEQIREENRALISDPIRQESFERRFGLQSLQAIQRAKLRETAHMKDRALENGTAIEDGSLRQISPFTTQDDLDVMIGDYKQFWDETAATGVVDSSIANAKVSAFRTRLHNQKLTADLNSSYTDESGRATLLILEELAKPKGRYSKASPEAREAIRGRALSDWSRTMVKLDKAEAKALEDKQQITLSDLVSRLPGEDLPDGVQEVTRAEIDLAIRNRWVRPEDSTRLRTLFSAAVTKQLKGDTPAEKAAEKAQDEVFDKLFRDVQFRRKTPAAMAKDIQDAADSGTIRTEQADKLQLELDQWEKEAETRQGKTKKEQLDLAEDTLRGEFKISTMFPDPQQQQNVNIGMAIARQAIDEGKNPQEAVAKYIELNRNKDKDFPANIADIVERGDRKFIEGDDKVRMTDVEMAFYTRYRFVNRPGAEEKKKKVVLDEDIKKQLGGDKSTSQIMDLLRKLFLGEPKEKDEEAE